MAKKNKVEYLAKTVNVNIVIICITIVNPYFEACAVNYVGKENIHVAKGNQERTVFLGVVSVYHRDGRESTKQKNIMGYSISTMRIWNTVRQLKGKSTCFENLFEFFEFWRLY